MKSQVATTFIEQAFQLFMLPPMKGLVKKYILGVDYFSATSDMWSSVGMKPYLSYTVHFVDSDWMLSSDSVHARGSHY